MWFGWVSADKGFGERIERMIVARFVWWRGGYWCGFVGGAALGTDFELIVMWFGWVSAANGFWERIERMMVVRFVCGEVVAGAGSLVELRGERILN